MKMATLAVTALTAAAALGGSTAAPLATPAAAASAPAHACDIKLNVIDQDPKGVNTHATPELRSDNVRTVLRHADWTRVHVIAQAGDWYQIDGYERMNDNADDEDGVMPGGHAAWIYKSELGDVDAQPNGMVYAQPNGRGKYLVRFPADESRLPKVEVLGCQGPWYKVRASGVTGWTRDVCTNERTTCA
jgi:hypothetical protein